MKTGLTNQFSGCGDSNRQRPLAFVGTDFDEVWVRSFLEVSTSGAGFTGARCGVFRFTSGSASDNLRRLSLPDTLWSFEDIATM